MTRDEAQNIVLENTAVEIIMSVDKTPDYYQIVGYAGGDILTYRVYHSGALTQR